MPAQPDSKHQQKSAFSREVQNVEDHANTVVHMEQSTELDGHG